MLLDTRQTQEQHHPTISNGIGTAMAVVELAACQQSPAHRRPLADGDRRGRGGVWELTASSWQRRGKYETTPTENLVQMGRAEGEQRAALQPTAKTETNEREH